MIKVSKDIFGRILHYEFGGDSLHITVDPEVVRLADRPMRHMELKLALKYCRPTMRGSDKLAQMAVDRANPDTEAGVA